MKNLMNLIKLITKAVSLAMGVAVLAMLIIEAVTIESAVLLLSIGLACAGLGSLIKETSEENK